MVLFSFKKEKSTKKENEEKYFCPYNFIYTNNAQISRFSQNR